LAQSGRVSGTELAAGLIRYSERGQAYVDELQAMIRVNGLELDPKGS
jgi:Bax protein